MRRADVIVARCIRSGNENRTDLQTAQISAVLAVPAGQSGGAGFAIRRVAARLARRNFRAGHDGTVARHLPW